MNIAIKGHASRGKEVIQILESLSGMNISLLKGNTDFWYFIDSYNNIVNDYEFVLNRAGFKMYTLEEFEKEFPFKVGDKVLWPITIGWWSGIITGINEELSRYEIIDEKRDYHYVAPSKLRLYPMKEERNITLTLDKAKEWYQKGGELREIALQAFTEKELTKVDLPKTWEEFYEQYKFKNTLNACLNAISTNFVIKYVNKFEAFLKLQYLRDCWRQDWEPDWNDGNKKKYCVCYYQGKFKISIVYEKRYFLSFPTYEMAEEFLKCFRDLIEQAGDLI